MEYMPVVSLHHGAVSLHHGVVSLHHGAVSLQHGVVSLHHGVVSLHHGVVSLHHGVVSLHHGVVSLLKENRKYSQPSNREDPVNMIITNYVQFRFLRVIQTDSLVQKLKYFGKTNIAKWNNS